MMDFYSKNFVINGASVIGRSHIMNGTCNQDNYSIYRKKYGIALSVCDGVGSNKFSYYGSKAATKAVNKVFKLYHRKKFDKNQIGENIEKYYVKYVKKRYREAAGTTCLFCYILDDSEIVIGQAGDGIILIELDDHFIVFQNKEDDFMNEVKALSCNYHYKYWKIKNLKFDFCHNNNLSLLLSTDGISEDIIPDKRQEFLHHFISLSQYYNDNNLQDELNNWSVPGSIDDKTVITFNWRK